MCYLQNRWWIYLECMESAWRQPPICQRPVNWSLKPLDSWDYCQGNNCVSSLSAVLFSRRAWIHRYKEWIDKYPLACNIWLLVWLCVCGFNAWSACNVPPVISLSKLILQCMTVNPQGRATEAEVQTSLSIGIRLGWEENLLLCITVIAWAIYVMKHPQARSFFQERQRKRWEVLWGGS